MVKDHDAHEPDPVVVKCDSADESTNMCSGDDDRSSRFVCVFGTARACSHETGESNENYSDESDVKDDDSDYIQPDSCNETDCSDSDSDEDTSSQFDADSKYIIFDEQLNILLRRCQDCGAPNLPDCTHKYRVGSMVVVKTLCTAGHEVSWKSQPTYGKAPAGNVFIAAAILFVGGLFTTFRTFATTLKLAFIGRTRFYKFQRNILCPVIHHAWTLHQQSLHDVLRGSNLELLGDARCDSPGYSAKYCTYTLMSPTGAVIDYELVHVSETNNNSGAMEKKGLDRLLERLQKDGMVIRTIATDRSPQVSSLLRKKYSHISHQYDIWHFGQICSKKDRKDCKKKRHCFSCCMDSVYHESHLVERSDMPWQCHTVAGQISVFAPAHNQYALMVVHEHSPQLRTQTTDK